MKKYRNLADYFEYRGRRFAERCTNCGACLEVCPVYPLTGLAGKDPRVVMEKITGLLKGGEVSAEAYEMVFSCNGGCDICSKACPEKLNLYSAFTSAIARIAGSGKQPPPQVYQVMPKNRYNFQRVFSALQSKPSERRWLSRAPANPRPAEIVLFAGCQATGMMHTFLETMGILDKMGVGYVALGGDELCCGTAAMLWGDLNAAQAMGEELVSNIAAFKPKKAVHFCTGCHVMCWAMLPRFMDVPFESGEVAQFLVDNLGRIPIQKRMDKLVTVHDACSVARLGSYENPRRLLQAIPGIRLVEMKHNRADSLCCGGATNTWRADISEPLRRVPLQEAEATGAQVLATTCTGCQKSFAPLERDYGFEVRSYISILAEAVGVSQEDNFKRFVGGMTVDEVLTDARRCIEASGYTADEMGPVLAEYFDRFCPGHGRRLGSM
ncbi:MAG: (Fe-S)-binding protein [Dehalococcoidia bacterium]|nr:(Fe-S)-binding protein [Dehalococcoidia bacterium]